MIKIDDKDEKILKELVRNYETSVKKLHQLTNIPIPTVYRRIKDMKKAGIIKKTKAVIDYKDIGMPICAILFVNIEESGEVNASGIMDELKTLSGVRELHRTFGEWDIIAKIQSESLGELYELLDDLRRKEGIEEVSSMLLASEEIIF